MILVAFVSAIRLLELLSPAPARAGDFEDPRAGFSVPFLSESTPEAGFSLVAGKARATCAIFSDRARARTARLESFTGLTSAGKRNLVTDRRNRIFAECRQQLLGQRRGQKKCHMTTHRVIDKNNRRRVVFSFLSSRPPDLDNCQPKLKGQRLFAQILNCPRGVLEILYYVSPAETQALVLKDLGEASCAEGEDIQ